MFQPRKHQMIRKLAVLVTLLSIVLGVYQDEAFQVDWLQYQYGRLIGSGLVDQNTIISLTDAKYLVGLDTNTGDVKWRYDFGFVSGSLVQLKDTVVGGLNFADGHSEIKTLDVGGGLLEEVVFPAEKILDLFVYQNKDVVIGFGNGDLTVLGQTEPIFKIDAVVDELKFSVHDGYLLVVANIGSKANYYIINKDFELVSEGSIGVKSAQISHFVENKFVIDNEVFIIDTKSKTVAPFSYPNSVVRVLGDYIAEFVPGSAVLSFFKPIDGTDAKFTFEEDIIDVVPTDELVIVFTSAAIYSLDVESDLYTKLYERITSASEKVLSSQIFESDSGSSILSLIENDLHTLSLVKNNETLWTKDTTLSSIIDHTVLGIDNPDAEIIGNEIKFEETLNVVSAYIYRLKTNLERLFSPVTEQEQSLNQMDNYFGFTKRLIVATKSGRISAIDTETGEVVWTLSQLYTDIVKISSLNNKALLFVQNEMITISYDGEILSTRTFDFNISKVFSYGSSGIFVKLENGLVETVGAVETDEDITIVEVGQEKKSLSAFKLIGSELVSTWTIAVKSDESIISAVSKDSDDVSGSIGIVLGDRSVLYKYLYPHVIALAIANDDDTVLTINLIDMVTGDLLYSTYQEGSFDSASVNLVYGEHWIIYSYVSYEGTSSPEQRLVVLDLFESLTPNERKSTDQEMSSIDADRSVEVSSKSFIFPERILRLGVSKTRYGVTIRSIIAYLATGELVDIPKYVINSRRIDDRALTSNDQEEFRISNYEPIISKPDGLVLNHVRPIAGAEKIISIATDLESTSIVCVYGLDLFCTRVQPSSQYDLLAVSFDKVMLLITIALLSVATIVSYPMVSNKNLNARWIDQ